MDESERISQLPYKLNHKLTFLLDGFKHAIKKKNTSVVILFDGRSGMGKTTLNNQVGKYCDPNYDLNKLHYDPEEFLNGTDGKIGLAQAKKGDYICFDEAMLISSRAALSQVNRMIVQAMSMIRSKNIIVGFCVNSIFDLDKNLVLSRADLLLNVYGASLTDRGQFMAFFKGSDGMDRLKMLYLLGKKYYSYAQPKSNFNTHFPSHFVLDEEEYEAQKQVGVNKFLKGLERTSIRTAEKQRNLYIKYLYEQGQLSQKEIGDISGMTNQNVSTILQKLREEPIEPKKLRQVHHYAPIPTSNMLINTSPIGEQS